MPGESNSRLYLLIQVVRDDIEISILWCVIVRIDVTMIVLDLYSSGYSHLTEGALISSGTTGDDLWGESKLICANDFAQLLDKICWLIS